MSIIHEALKKAQQSLQKNTSAAPAEPIIAVGPAPAYRQGAGKVLLFFVLLVIICAALSAGYMYWRTRPAKIAIVALSPAPPKKDTTPPPAGPAKTIVPAADTASKPALKIQGIMADPKGNVALINDKIYAEGDDIDGAKIVRISLDSIVISRDGKEETLSAKH